MKQQQRPITPETVNLLVYLYQRYNNSIALNKLWDFYFPLIKDVILYHIAKKYQEIDEYTAEIVDDSYVFFVEGVSKYNRDSYCFGAYIQEYVEKTVLDNLEKYYQESTRY